MTQATEEQIHAVVHDEPSGSAVVVGGKSIQIRPLKRRWQSLFARAALPLFRAELAATEEIQKAFAAGNAEYTSFSKTLIDSELEADAALDRAAAVIMASQVPGAEKNPEDAVQQQAAWLADNSTTAELWALVEAQEDQERLVMSVGERWPARLLRSANLAGDATQTRDTVRRLWTTFLRSLADRNGDGSSTGEPPSG